MGKWYFIMKSNHFIVKKKKEKRNPGNSDWKEGDFMSTMGKTLTQPC